MDSGSREAVQAAVAATVAVALRQSARRSVHPADLTAVWQAASRIAAALDAEFLLVSRQSPSVGLPEHRPLSVARHE